MFDLNLDELSNDEVKLNIIRLRKLERECEVDLLFHLIELEKRDLHLAWGYSSLFAYLVTSLGYSEASASRRVRISRLICKYPDIARMLRSGKTNLSCLSLISKVLEEDSDKGCEILASIADKTCREVEELVSVYRPEVTRSKEYIKPIKVAGVAKSDCFELEFPTKSFCNLQDSLIVQPPLLETPQAEVRYEVRCSLSKEIKDKLGKAQNLMVHRLKGDMVLENVFSELIDCYLAKHANDRKVRKVNRVQKSLAKGNKGSAKRDAIPSQVKREVYARDHFCCSYQSKDGVRCGKESNLELDHITPVALGGDNSVANLRVVCREHNQFLAREVFGKEFMMTKI